MFSLLHVKIPQGYFKGGNLIIRLSKRGLGILSGGKNGGEWGRSVNGELREFQGLGKMDPVLDVLNASGNEVKPIEIVTRSPFEWCSPRFQRRSPSREPNIFCQDVEIL